MNLETKYINFKKYWSFKQNQQFRLTRTVQINLTCRFWAMFLLKSDLFLNTKYFEDLLKLNITMQGKLRLKAHKLWSHLVVSFRKLPQINLPAYFRSTLSLSLKIHAPVPELARPVCTCSEIHNHIPNLNYKLRMAIYI